MPSIFSFSLKLWYFFKKKFYWCKALGPVNLEQTSKMVIKTTTVIKTDERKTNGCYRKVLQNKTSVNLQEINISSIKLQLIITGKKLKQKSIFYKNKNSKLRVKPRVKPSCCPESNLICFSLWCELLCCTCRIFGLSLVEQLFTH